MLKFWLSPKAYYPAKKAPATPGSRATTITECAKSETRGRSRTQTITAESTLQTPGTGHTDSSKAEGQTTRMWPHATPQAVSDS